MILIKPIVFAKEMIEVTSSKKIVEKGEEFEITVGVNNTSIASLTLQIYFDIAKLEYLNRTKNSNFSQNRVIYTWVDSLGGETNSESNEIEKFTFRALQDGIANIVVTGEFYDKNGNKIEIDDGSFQIQVGSKENEQEENDSEQVEQVSSDNTNLKIMRINEEGISPEFQKDIKEYYFIADMSIDRLNITAVPENKDATVTVTGNTNLKKGLNVIKINVQSADKTKKSAYTIYVTKTDNKEVSNGNLENLAVREAMLFPSFDANITHYEIEVATDIHAVDILAVPERTGATVTVEGNDKLEIGDNTITINVAAEDGITNKKYIIKAHRRSEQEEITAKEEQEKGAQQLAAILANEQEENNQVDGENELNNKKMKTVDIITIVLLVIVVIGFTIGLVINRKKRRPQ